MSKLFFRTTLALLLVAISIDGQSQKDSTLSQKISRDFCEEFSKKNFTSYKDSEMEIGLLILPLITKYEKEIEKEWKLSASNMEDLEKIGEKVGQEAAVGCPKFFEFIKNNLSDILPDEEAGSAKSLEGVLTGVEEQTFTYLLVKTKTNKEEKLWWFGHFEGADEFIKNKDSLLKKTVKIEYNDMEVYDPRVKEYRSIKVIKKITIL